MTSVPGRAVMRDHTVEERASSPLELFFDLCFVVAVAFLAAGLHHGIADGHAWSAVATYALLFIPIWWAWMSYTWFATAFSHDDAITRVLTFGQMLGILAVAAAIPSAIDGELVPFALAYAAMRTPLILQWLRSAAADREYRAFAMTYAVGSTVAQVLWVAGAFTSPPVRVAVFVAALAIELATPVRAVRRSPGRTFHPRHIAERYGLFTIIVLGETVLATAIGLREVIESGELDAFVLAVVTLGLLIAFVLWWLYFATLDTRALERNRKAAFIWGYGHYAAFAALAAVGAGVTVEADVQGGHHDTGAAVVAAAVAIVLSTLAVMRRAALGVAVGHLLVGALALLAVAALTPPVGAVASLLATAVIAVGVLVGQLRRQAEDVTTGRAPSANG